MMRPTDGSNRSRCVRSRARIAIAALCAAPLLTAAAQQAPPPALATQRTGAQAAVIELTAADAEAWLDGYLRGVLERSNIAGGVVVVVRDGNVLLQKGYGFADLEHRTTVDPERTLFRLGSISKVFTATAVMQLVEDGKLELDRDINDYLDFKVPGGFGRAITLRHLLTHAAGFEETAKDAWTIDTAKLQPLALYLPTHLPNVIYPPGHITAYSNYGITLAGYIVQRVANEPFESYVERRIFGPLGMERSTFRQPVPAALEADLSRGYVKASAGPRPFEICAQTPAGSLSSSGSDMARFMLAHLHEGRYGDAQILRPETARLMHSRVTDVFPSVNGMALGFRQADRNGRRIISHGGDTGLFHSAMALLLDEGAGIYVSLNSTGSGGDVRGDLVNDFLDRYFPALPAVERPTTTTSREHAQLAAGWYESSRRWESSLFRVLGLAQQVHLTVADDGALIVPVETGPTTSVDVRWREVEPFVWQEVGGTRTLAMRFEDGRVIGFKNNDLSSMVFLRSPWWRAPTGNLLVLLGSLVWILVTLVAGVLVALFRRKYGVVSRRSSGSHTITRTLAYTGAIASLLLIVALIGLLSNLTTGSLHFLSESDLTVRGIQLLGLLVTVGAGAAVLNAWIAFRERRAVRSRLQSIMLAGACLGITWFVWSNHLITTRLTF